MEQLELTFLKFAVYCLFFILIFFGINEWIKSINKDKDDYYGK